jgi:hypothetical protein
MRTAAVCAHGAQHAPAGDILPSFTVCRWAQSVDLAHLPPFVQRAAQAGGLHPLDYETCQCFRERA